MRDRIQEKLRYRYKTRYRVQENSRYRYKKNEVPILREVPDSRKIKVPIQNEVPDSRKIKVPIQNEVPDSRKKIKVPIEKNEGTDTVPQKKCGTTQDKIKGRNRHQNKNSECRSCEEYHQFTVPEGYLSPMKRGEVPR
jgi:hypothetical protein